MNWLQGLGSFGAGFGQGYLGERDRKRDQAREDKKLEDAKLYQAQLVDKANDIAEANAWLQRAQSASSPEEAQQYVERANLLRSKHKLESVPVDTFAKQAANNGQIRDMALAREALGLTGGDMDVASGLLGGNLRGPIENIYGPTPQAQAAPPMPQAAPTLDQMFPGATPPFKAPQPAAPNPIEQALAGPTPTQLPAPGPSFIEDAIAQVKDKDKSFLPFGLLPQQAPPNFEAIQTQMAAPPPPPPPAQAPPPKPSPFVMAATSAQRQRQADIDRESRASLADSLGIGIARGQGYKVFDAMRSVRDGKDLTEDQKASVDESAGTFTAWRGSNTERNLASAKKMLMEEKYIPEKYRNEARRLADREQQTRNTADHNRVMEEIAKLNATIRGDLNETLTQMKKDRAATEDIQWAEEMAQTYDVMAQRAGPRTDEFGMTVPGDPAAQARYSARADDYRARAGGATTTKPAGTTRAPGSESDRDFCFRIYQNAPTDLRAEMDKSHLTTKDLANWLRKQGCK